MRRRVVAVVAVIVAGLVAGWTVWHAAPGLAAAVRSRGADAAFEVVSAIVRQPPLRWLLMPFDLMVRPLTAPSAAAWVHAIWPAAGILLLHFVWVIRSDAAFEESAVEHTLARARRERPNDSARKPFSGSVRHPLPRILRLAPTGWPAGAILWKNLVSVVRVRPVRGAVVTGIVAGLGSALLSFGAGTALSEIVGWLALMWAVVMLFVGPQWIRNDLRSDFAHFDLLRSYPIPGRSVVAAEAAGSATVLTLMQLALLLLAYLAFLGNETMELTLTERTLGLVAAVVYLPAISFLSMLIQNAGAILFPTWIRPGPERASGVEALGQNMLLIIAHVGIIAVLMAVPFGAATAVQVVLHPALAGWAEIPRAAVFLGLIAFEAHVIVGWLGGVLERTDPASIGV